MTERGVALITGGAKRIGRAIVEGLSRRGYTVIVHANSSAGEAEGLVEQLRAEGQVAHFVVADLCDEGALAEILPRAADMAGTIDLLINNASVFENDSIGNLDTNIWDRHFSIHVKAPVFLANAFATQLPGDRDGLVVNIIDQRVWRLTPHFLSYTLSKSALWTATQTMALALAPRIRINAIGPGPTVKNPRQSAEDFRRQEEAVPLQHGPELPEFASTIEYLWSNKSITGQMIALDGGQHLAWETPDVVGIPE